ncbi:hypothetical protein KK083_23220 [Fulvivirgaceae bacterium PWU4]|uniref:Uncharacterized protein n=1 Tax=Chryseosolibacter histidini TaxID=2782349 RepID=A0AAP2GQ58_9BACT|nr:hypothetical protein [Chryseosolibacter histidini]MBT1699818.1 hypothetical protein [Chryseosolibacter histidini]
MFRFFIALLLTAAVIAATVLLAASSGYFAKPSFFLKTLILLTFATGMIYVYLYKANKPEFFLQLYLLTMVVKLLAYCAYNLVMIISDRAAATGNVVFFMVTYFVFTILEVGFLYRKITGRDQR